MNKLYFSDLTNTIALHFNDRWTVSNKVCIFMQVEKYEMVTNVGKALILALLKKKVLKSHSLKPLNHLKHILAFL